MKKECSFRFSHIEECFRVALDSGYRIITCQEYSEYKRSKSRAKILVNRVDIDVDCKKARRLASIFNELDIKGTFFVRLHAKEYNPFSLENYRCIKYIRDTGHEIGLHSEVVDAANIWNEEARAAFIRDLQVLRMMFGIEIKGVSSHGSLTEYNNLDFWDDKSASDFDLSYEAYDRQPEFGLFYESFYVSDSNWINWKCYEAGVLKEGDRRCFCEHLRDGHQIVSSLIHPETYFDEHFYE